MTQIIMIDKLSMQITMKDNTSKYWSDSLSSQWIHQAVITVSRSTWKTKKWRSRDRSFLYGYDRSLGMQFLKLGVRES